MPDKQAQGAAQLQEMRDQHWTDQRRDELQFGEQTEAAKQNFDFGAYLVHECKTAQDVAAVITKTPQFTRQIFLAANQMFGAQIAKEAVELAQSGDHSVTVGNRGLLDTTAEDSYKDKNAPNPADKLPWLGKEAWDGFAINQKLGQYDLIGGTDSDGARCGFANALAVKVLDGPKSTLKWLETFITIYSRDKQTPRQTAAKDVISAVYGAIQGGTATYGDLSWLQEGLHDWAFSNEDQGVKNTTVMAVGMDKQDIAVTCASAKELVKECKANLGAGERMFFEWQNYSADVELQFRHFVTIANHNGANYIYDSEVVTGSHMIALDDASAKRFFPTKHCRMLSEVKIKSSTPAKP